MAEKLTDARVRSAPALGGKRTDYRDTVEAGLELRVHADGRRMFTLRRSVCGRDVRITIGQFGPAPLLSLEQARAQSAEVKLRLRREGDFRPAERVARRVRRDYTVDDLIDDWLAYAEKRLRASTLALHRHRFDKHIRAALGNRPLDQVSRADVRALVAGIGDRGHARTANAVSQLVSALYRFARSELERDVANPAADLKGFREHVRTRVLSDEELRTFLAGLDNTNLPPGPQTALALKLALFSAQRIGEIIGMRDNELDFAERVWTTPAARTKSGRLNRLPLTPMLIWLIRQAQALRGASTPDAPVFPSPLDRTQPMRRLTVSQGMARLCKKLELHPASPHDLRRTARTILSRERLGVSYEDAERVMSHVVGSSVSRVYNHHDYLPQKRRSLEALSHELDRILTGRSIQTEHIVVEFGALT